MKKTRAESFCEGCPSGKKFENMLEIVSNESKKKVN